MKVLIIIAHGSKVQSSNDEIKNICKNISNLIDLSNSNYDFVDYAFLELAEPTFDEILSKYSLDSKIKNITVFPYFLAAGKHVKVDIPEIIEKYKKSNKNIEFKVLQHFGKCHGIEKLILANS